MSIIFTVRHRGIGTGIAEASNKSVPIFSFATQGGKQVNSYFRQGNSSDKDTMESAIDNLDTIKVYAFFLSKTHHWSAHTDA
jgi:hypothetical protein